MQCLNNKNQQRKKTLKSSSRSFWFSTRLVCVSEDALLKLGSIQTMIVFQKQRLRRIFGAITMQLTPPPCGLCSACSKAVVLLLFIYCLIYFPLLVGVLCMFLICYALIYVHSSFVIILKKKKTG